MTTAAEFDATVNHRSNELTERLERIARNPNPRSFRGRVINAVRKCVTWGRTLHREAALDSFKNTMAVIGVGTVLADFGTMRAWLLLPCAVLLFLIWFADYHRHEGI